MVLKWIMYFNLSDFVFFVLKWIMFLCVIYPSQKFHLIEKDKFETNDEYLVKKHDSIKQSKREEDKRSSPQKVEIFT